MGNLRAFFEQDLRRRIGNELTDLLREASVGMPLMPIGGTPYLVTDGRFVAPVVGGAGFYSLSQLIYRASNGGRQDAWFHKDSLVSGAGRFGDLWRGAGYPGPGAAPSDANGEALTNASAGALQLANPTSSIETPILVSAQVRAVSGPGGLLVLYDRLWHGLFDLSDNTVKTVNTSPSRYTGTKARGNRMFISVEATQSTVGNFTVTYIDGDGTQRTMLTASVAQTFGTNFTQMMIAYPRPLFLRQTPPETYGVGVRSIVECQHAISGAGSVIVTIARPLMWLPAQLTVDTPMDGVNNPLGWIEIARSACLSFAEVKSSGGVTSYAGSLVMVDGEASA